MGNAGNHLCSDPRSTGARSIELGVNGARLRPDVQASGRSLELARTCRTALLKALVPGQSGGSTRISVDARLGGEPKAMKAVRPDHPGPSFCRSARRGSAPRSRQLPNCKPCRAPPAFDLAVLALPVLPISVNLSPLCGAGSRLHRRTLREAGEMPAPENASRGRRDACTGERFARQARRLHYN
jgi:hypothetical protein